jgi:hypothetical protein
MREEREQAKAERAEMEACAEAKLEAVRQESEAEKAELRSEVQKCRQEVDQMRAQVAETQQLEALQLRLQVLHASKLLSDEEAFKVEDAVADSLEASDGCVAAGDGEVAKLLALSAKMRADPAFARQLRRRFA